MYSGFPQSKPLLEDIHDPGTKARDLIRRNFVVCQEDDRNDGVG